MLLGGYLRITAFQEFYPDKVTIAGDALEYQWYVSHILRPLPVPPPDRMPGLPLLLLPAFATMPGSYDDIQAWTTTLLSVALIAAIFQLAAVRVGRAYGLLVALLVAVNPVLVHNAARGLTEELFLLCMTGALLLYSRIMDGSKRTNRAYVLLGVCGGALALTRYDSALALIPLFLAAVAASWRDGRWQERVLRILPLGLLPFLFLAASRWYAEVQGFQNIVWRTGNRFFWQEFLRGHMPYQYMFYAEITMKDWLLDYHSLWDLVHMGLMGTVHTIIALGEIVGGQAILLAAVAGAVLCIVRQRDWALPCSVVLILLPQYAFGRFHGEGDMFRYLLRVLPFVMLLSVVTLRTLVEWLAQQDWWPEALRRSQLSSVALLAVTVALPVWSPVSIYRWVMPHVSQAWQVSRFDSTEQELVKLWNGFSGGSVSADSLVIKADALRQLNPDWAPTHMALGIGEYQRGDRGTAISHLQEAVRLVPWFVEAEAILAEHYLADEQWDRFHHTVDSMVQSRPDHPVAYLLAGHAALIAGSGANAQAAYEEYIRINHDQSRTALERQRRFRVRRDHGEFVQEIDVFLMEMDSDPIAGLQTPVLWTFLVRGLGLGMAPMHDEDTYYNLGLAASMQGNMAMAEKRWWQALAVAPGHGLAWGNLGIMLARQGRLQEALDWLRRPPPNLALAPSIRLWLEAQVVAQMGDQRSADALFDRAEAEEPVDGWEREYMKDLKTMNSRTVTYMPPRIVLPMTKIPAYIGH